MTDKRESELTVERDILIAEVQRNQDIEPGDKDHLRQAINGAYDAALNGDIADLAASNIVWTRINIRSFALLQRVDKRLEEISDGMQEKPQTAPQDCGETAAAIAERRINAYTRFARVAAWPLCVLAAIIAAAFILRPELASIAASVVRNGA